MIYGIVNTVRNGLFDLKFWKSKYYSKPTIGVGNLSMGGTGKSVVVTYLIALLKKEHPIAVLSRGYKRLTKGFVLADKKATAKTIGDEPYQFFKKNTDIMVAVAEKRVIGMEQLLRLKHPPEVFVWDDVFQHRHVTPRLMILTTTYHKPYFKDYVFPMGTLRERRIGVGRAHIILMTKCPENLSRSQAEEIKEHLKLQRGQHLFFTRIQYDPILRGQKTPVLLESLNREPFLLVCGIANPEPLIQYLKAQGHQFETLLYPDHFNFDQKAVYDIRRKALHKKILTTEKDYGRLYPYLKTEALYYLPIQMGFVFPKEQAIFDRLVRSSITDKN